MSWLKKLLGGKQDDGDKSRTPGVVDLRSGEERQMEKDARKAMKEEDEAFAQKLSRLATGSMEHWESDRAEIRRIGEQLSQNGGLDRMKRVCYRVGAICGRSRVIEGEWDGIGGWWG